MVVANASLGMRVEHILGVSQKRPSIIRFLTSFALGLVLLWSLLFILVMIPGGFNRTTVSLFFIVSIVSGIRPLLACLQDIFKKCRFDQAAIPSFSIWWILGIIALILLAWKVILSSLPFFGDASAFYMVLPKVIAYSKGMVSLQGWEKIIQLGVAPAMHSAAAMLLFGEKTVAFFLFSLFIGALGLSIEIGRLVGLSYRGLLLLAAMMLASSAVYYPALGGNIGYFSIFPSISAVYWCFHIANYKYRSAAICGILLGGGIYAKLSTAPTLVVIVMAMIFWSWFRNNAVTRKNVLVLSKILVFVIFISFFAYFPNLIMNGLMYQKPFLPFYPYSDILSNQGQCRSHYDMIGLILSYPFALTWGFYALQFGRISPAVIALYPSFLIIQNKKALLKSPACIVALIGFLSLVLWIILFPRNISPRHFVPTTILLMILPAKCGEILLCPGTRFRWAKIAGKVCIPLILLSSILQTPRGFSLTTDYLFGPYDWESPAEGYLRCPAAISKEVSGGERVLVASFYIYPLSSEQISTMYSSQEREALKSLSSGEKRWSHLYEEGVRYILIDSAHASFGNPQERYEFSIFGGLLDSGDLPPDLELVCLGWYPPGSEPYGTPAAAAYRLQKSQGMPATKPSD